MSVVAPPLQLRLSAPLVGFEPVAIEQANSYLVAWGHYLGASTRACATRVYALEINGEPVSVAVSAAPITQTVAGLPFNQVVELTRLCSAPTARWATRPMLRLWREVAVPMWPHWKARAAIAYSANNRHEGTIYRFDGWKMVTDKAGKLDANSSWDYNPTPDSLGHKRLWMWRYDEAIV